MNKKAIIILSCIFVLIVGTLGYIIYSRYQTPAEGGTDKNPVSQNPSPTPTPPPPSTPAGQFFKLGNEAIVSPALLYSGSGVTYFDTLGQVYIEDFVDNDGRIELDRKRKLDYPALANIEKVVWPLTGPNFIVQIKNGSSTSWSSFDPLTKEYVPLPAQVQAVDFSPDGDTMYYVWVENGKATLNTANPNNTNWKQVSDMWELDNTISVSPDGKNILYYETNNSGTTNAINLTTPDGKVWKSLVKEGYNYGVLWSPDGKQFLYQKKDQNAGKYELWLYDLLSDTTRSLSVYSSVDKAVWDGNSKFVYVAVPTGEAATSSFTMDKLYRLDVTAPEASVKQYDPGALEIDAQDLSVNGNGTRVFFKNGHDGALYYLDVSE